MSTAPPIYGLLAEFEDPTSLVSATHEAYAHGYRCMDAYSPFPIEELHHAIGMHHTRLPLIVLIGGLVGGLSGLGLQYWVSAVAYPLNIGGKPFHSWPSFIVVTFEMTILFGGISAVFGMLALNGLPMPYHPVFNVARFAMASKDRFFLIVFSSDKKYDDVKTREFLESLGPKTLTEVPD